MKFSMIVPLYHGQKYIPALVEMAQENKKTLGAAHFLELILVNDSPETPVKVEPCATAELCVAVVENEKNCGIHATRIIGMRAAQGQYVLLLDQDDKISGSFFASQLKHLHENTDVVIANGVTEAENHEKLLYRWSIMHWTVKHMIFYALFDCRILSPGQCLIRKESVPVEWLEHPLRCNGADDMLLWLMMLSRKAHFTINRDILYRHCYTANNVSLDTVKMTESVNELIQSAGAGACVKKSVLRLLSSRLAFQTGEKVSLFWKLLFSLRSCGESLNRT